MKEQTKESEQKCFLPGLLFFYAKKEEHHEIKSQGTGKTDASWPVISPKSGEHAA